MNRWTISSITIALMLMMVVPASFGQDSSNANDGISAGLVAKELRALGYSAKIDQDESGDPRVNTKVDGHDWSVYFYDCGKGDIEERNCVSFQFYSGYTVSKGFPLETINKWNIEKRYAKAYVYLQRDKTYNARIEIDVLVSGTGADASRAFQAYFTKMKNASEGFRKAIGVK